ncbi:MAG: 6-phosphogluconolactonase [Terricaulis sp.]
MFEPLIFPSRDALMEAAGALLAEALTQGVTIRGRACAALSGGTTPGPAYTKLAERDMNWRRVSFALVDERFVAPSEEASNESMLRRTLAPAFAAGASLVPLYSPDLSLEAAALAAETRYAPLHLDIALLGMGGDGHVASWFHGARGYEHAIDPASKSSVAALHAPQAYGTPERLSLTFAKVAQADHVLLLLLGDEKRARFEAALTRAPEEAPVAALKRLSRAPEIFWAA